MSATVPAPLLRPAPQQRHRTWRVTGAVVLAHALLLWLIGQELLGPTAPVGEAESVIMASVVAEQPAPPAPLPQPPAPVPKPQPAPRPATASPVAAQAQPSPLLAPAAPGNTAPAVPAATPTPAAAPAATTPRPATPSAAVVLPSSDADYLNNPPPTYPRMSRRMGEQGTVLLRVFISAEGRAEQAEIRTSSGHARLDEAALETARRWRYVPGKRAGVAEAMWFNVPIRFVLD